MLNKWTLYAFLSGLIVAGLAVYFLMPTKIETHEVEKVVERVVNRDVVKHSVKTVYKDGTVTVVTDTQDKSKEVAKEILKESTKKTVGLNSKKVLIYTGINPLERSKWLVGASYNFLGPIDVGFVYIGSQDSYKHSGFVTAGLRF